ncbi:MAG: bifunctional UDP-N-acetylglucosamine diphosphorylase/glucosamine-1-phosphate N-acetyltransferase GlmU [Pseudomonadota bacterium]
MSAPLNVVILAAGKGTRMHSDLPKVLHTLAGRPLIGHVLAAADALDPARICVVYGHGGDVLPQAVGREDLVWVRQEPQLGTGHAVQQAMPRLDPAAVVLILYGDVPLIRSETLQEMVTLAQGGAVALLTVRLANPAGYGRIVRDAQGRVERIVEHKDASAEELALHEVNTGIMALPARQLGQWLARLSNANAQGEYYLTDVIAMAAAEQVPILPCHPAAVWEVLGVNSRAQLAELERTHQHNLAEALLAQGVTLLDPKRLDIRGELACGRDVIIDINCLFEGRVSLADGVRVGAHCVLKNVEVEAGVEILPFTHIEGARLGAGSRIGPYARIRPGTELAEATHIGNFVEIKNSRIGHHSKVNHLSYVGDATVGGKVNIGAGSITANYDGANKHHTEIGDDASIGSNCVLVAPVRVGAAATIGAGSVISKDAPAGELTVARARAVTIPGWKRPVKKQKEGN